MFSRDKFQEIEFQPGDIIFREGSHCDALIIIKGGQVEVFKTGLGNKKIILGLVQSGEYLGEMALLSQRPHSATAIALTHTTCIRITSTAIEEHLKQMPGWLVALIRGLVNKLNKTNTLLKRNGIQDDSLSTAIQAITNRENNLPRKTNTPESQTDDTEASSRSSMHSDAPNTTQSAASSNVNNVIEMRSQNLDTLSVDMASHQEIQEKKVV